MDFVPWFSSRSVRLVNRHWPCLPISTSSRNGLKLLVGGRQPLWSRGGCIHKRAKYFCSWKPAIRHLLIYSIIRRLAHRGGCIREQAKYSCSWTPATRHLLICSIIRKLTHRPGHGWSCWSISLKKYLPPLYIIISSNFYYVFFSSCYILRYHHLFFWIEMRILGLKVWGGSENMLFIYTRIRVWSMNQNFMYMFTLSMFGIKVLWLLNYSCWWKKNVIME